VVEHTNEESLKIGIGILALDRFDEGAGDLGAVGVELQKTVVAALQALGDFFRFGGGFFDEGGEFSRRKILGNGLEFFSKAKHEIGCPMRVFLKSVERLVLPVCEHMGARAFLERDMDMDGRCLTDAVEATYALFQQLGVLGEVEQDEVVGELKIPAFTAYLGANEQAGAVLLGEVGGIAVALEESESLVEDSGGDFDLLLEAVQNIGGRIRRFANHENLLLLEFFEEGDEPADFCGGFVCFGSQRSQVGLAFGKAGESGAGVSKDNPPRAVFVEQRGDHPVACGDISRQKIGIVTSHTRAFEYRGARDFFSRQERIDGFCDGLVVVGFLEKGSQVVVAVGVEQAEAREMAFHAELLRGCREQKQ
jgi:hypothetical protein